MNQKYDINEEFEINISFNVKLNRITDYSYLTEEELKKHVQDFKNNIAEDIRAKNDGNWFGSINGCCLDYYDYDVK